MSSNTWLDDRLDDSRKSIEEWPDWLKKSSQTHRYEESLDTTVKVKAVNSPSKVRA